jgi:antibiotic biosynthesis monooxygenase (ABM) superfamily enzyme
VFFMLEKAIHRFVHEQSDLVPAFVPVSHHTLSFLVAYMAQVVPQHLLHALLVYGIRTIDTPAKYLKTLAGTYSAFAMSMVGSTVLNSVLVKFWSKDAAFVSTIVVFATVNYFFITWVVRITARQ